MGLREITGAVVTAFLAVYMLWFVIPVTRTAYNTELAQLNTSSSLMQTILPITNNWWIIFPLLITVVGGYTIWLYISDRDAFNY